MDNYPRLANLEGMSLLRDLWDGAGGGGGDGGCRELVLNLDCARKKEPKENLTR